MEIKPNGNVLMLALALPFLLMQIADANIRIGFGILMLAVFYNLLTVIRFNPIWLIRGKFTENIRLASLAVVSLGIALLVVSDILKFTLPITIAKDWLSYAAIIGVIASVWEMRN